MAAVQLVDKDKIVFAAQIFKVQTMDDQTLRLTIDTQEFPEQEAGFIVSKNKKLVAIVLKVGTVDEEDIAIANAARLSAPPAKKKDKPRSPSQRLRDAIWIRWRELGEPGDFDEEYYPSVIEGYINFENIQLQQLKNQG